MNQNERDEFDRILEEILEELPAYVREQLDEIPLIVEDEPSSSLREEMGEDDLSEPSDLCGLHSGVSLPDRSVTSVSPSNSFILLFRGPIYRLSGKREKGLRKEIRITLLHEIGHHFGFSEEKLHAMGYG